MDILIRATGIALLGSVFALLLKRNTPELGLMLALSAVGALLLCVFDLFGTVADFIRNLEELASLPEDVLAPLFKTTGIAIITKLTAEACRDAEQKAVAVAAELTGSLLALVVAIPLFNRLLELIKSLM